MNDPVDTTPYEELCFVAMPFGSKRVDGREVDFDRLYTEVFAPAVAAAVLPEGGHLTPRRADEDFFAGVIDEDMYRYLEYSRFVLADITGLNPNVFYELGVRHRARESGTAIFQSADAAVPFDISHVRVFPYETGSDDEARALVTRVLTESLQRNRVDSPVAVALRAQREGQGPGRELDKVLIEAENAIRADDRPTAIQAYRKAILLDPSNFTLRLEAGVLLRDAGGWEEAVATLDEAVRLEPSSAAAWRELGVALNKLHALGGDDRTGEDELRRAVEIDPRDFDAWSSLGGILKRKPDFPGALKAYERAVAESGGASYPLLNAMKLRAAKAGPLVINSRDQLLLRRAKRGRTLQTVQDPPYDTPWSFFDLAEICLYLGDVEGFRRAIDEGLLHSTHGWQAETFANSLELVSLMGEADDAVRDVIELLRATADVLS